jgi:hypothetical protein
MGNNAMNEIEPIQPQNQIEEMVTLMQAALLRLDDDDAMLAKSLISAAIKIATQ